MRVLIAYFSKDKAIAPVLNTPIQWLWRKWPVLEMITSFFPFLGFSPSGTQFYEAIVGSSSKPPFLLASKRKKKYSDIFWSKKNRHGRCTGFSEVHQLGQKMSREHIDLMEFNGILKMFFQLWQITQLLVVLLTEVSWNYLFLV